MPHNELAPEHQTYHQAGAGELNPEAELRLIAARSGPNPAPEDLARFRELISKNPGLWRIVADPARRAAAISLDHSDIPVMEKEGMTTGFFELIGSFDYELAHPVIRLLIDQVALRWLQLGAVDRTYSEMKELKPAERIQWEKRLTATHQRFTRACESLAQVQRALRLTQGSFGSV